MGNEFDDSEWRAAVVSTLKGADSEKANLKDLRRLVLISLQCDESDKSAKKHYKRTIKSLEEDGTLTLDADGKVELKKKKKKRKSDKASKKEKKRTKKEQTDAGENDHQEQPSSSDKESSNQESPTRDKNKPCKGNPQGVTRLFLGNLPFAVDEASLGDFLPGTLTHIKWITDKETGKFYGSAFCEMDTSESAAAAVAKAGTQLMGRPIKINFAPAREGDIWPPEKKVVSGGGQAGGSGVKAMSEKPEGCVKLFIGNMSYDIDDEDIYKFFANVDAEVKAVRWLHHQDSGDFKGCGFVEFWKPEACEKAATLNGKTLLGRPIRIDWSD
jgi:nucleolin